MTDKEDYTTNQLDKFHLREDGLLQPSGLTKTPRNPASPTDQEARDAALKAELRGLKNMNAVIGGIHSSLEKARANMETVSNTISNSNQLLDLWVRILSQSEHTQRLVLSPHWQGGNKDIEDEESEIEARLREEERRKVEERERQLERERAAIAAATAKEAEQKRPPSAIRGSRGIRRPGAPSTRGSAISNRSGSEITTVSGKGSRGPGRIARGIPRARGAPR